MSITCTTFKKDDFGLAIMTAAQSEILLKYGSDCICVDSTHGMNAYGFQLTTVMVLDDMRQGFPCAFFLCNRSDTKAIEEFFKAIKDRIGIVSSKVFMSDMDDTFYNAWSCTMGESENRLYCTWHVDRAWKTNLKK